MPMVAGKIILAESEGCLFRASFENRSRRRTRSTFPGLDLSKGLPCQVEKNQRSNTQLSSAVKSRTFENMAST